MGCKPSALIDSDMSPALEPSLHDSSGDSLGRDVPRKTLIDYFEDLARARGQFLVYDDGFKDAAIRHRMLAAPPAGSPRDSLRQASAKVTRWCSGVRPPESIVAFWGCLLGGVIVVPIDYRASPEFLTRIATRVAAPFVAYSWVLAAALWMIVAAVAVASGGQLSRPRLWRRAA